MFFETQFVSVMHLLHGLWLYDSCFLPNLYKKFIESTASVAFLSTVCFAYLPGNCLATIGCCCRTYLIYPLRGLFGGPLDWEVRYFTGLMNVAGTTLVDLQTM